MTLAFICGCAGTVLTPEEGAFFSQTRPWGLILFKRNVGDPGQLRALTGSFRRLVGRSDAPVLIDQEGGRVQRMGPPHWPAYPAAARFENIGDPERASEIAGISARLMARDLLDVGVNVDCAPVLDVPQPGAHVVIGERAWSIDPGRVAAFGGAVARGLTAGGVAPVMKHIPGHGRAGVDSHFELPIVMASRAELEGHDFVPFAALRSLPMAMTAHVVYRAIDPDRPATTSRSVVTDIIRGRIGFDGLLLSDDLSMKALGGPLGERAAATFAAGVDIALHCNGDLDEAREVARSAPELAGESLRRARMAMASVAGGAGSFDIERARAQLAAAFEPARAG